MNDTVKKLRVILVDMITRQLKTSTDNIITDVIAVENMLVEDLMTVIIGMDPDDDRYYEFHDTICGFVADMNERFGV